MTQKDQKNTVFAAAVKEAGGQAAFGEMIKKTQQAVSCMLKKGICPAEYVVKLEKATSGKFPRHVLRPDLYMTSMDCTQ